MKKFKHILCTLSLALGLPALHAQSLSLSQALNLMETKNGKLQGYQSQAQAAQFGIDAAKGLYFPQLTMSGKIIHMNDDLSLNLNKYKYALTSFIPILKPEKLGDWRFPFQEADVMSLQADVKWPIFTGGKIKAANRAAKIKKELALAEVETVKSQLISEVSTRYFQVQLAQEAVKVRKQAQEAAQKHFYDAEQLEKNGMIAPAEKMMAETAVADANRELHGAEKDVTLAQTALWGALNTEPSAQELSTPLFEVVLLNDLAYYQKQAQQNYPEIAKARLKKQLAEQDVALKKSKFMPDIALVGSKYLLTENLPITEPDWYVGVGMQIDIFTGMKNRKEYAQSKAVSQSVDLLTQQAERDIQTLVKKQFTEIQKQQEQLQSLKKSLSFAEELLRVREKAFHEGFAKSTDVVDANLYLASIKMQKLQALFAMDKALAEMLETCGLSHTLNQYIIQ
uniref:TolC family protein n=1 Tax=Ornithobacterium rhinotracheale TaxID=28251 RepID=UPI0039A48963